MSKPCGSSIGHDDCGYIFINKGQESLKAEVPKEEKVIKKKEGKKNE